MALPTRYVDKLVVARLSNAIIRPRASFFALQVAQVTFAQKMSRVVGQKTDFFLVRLASLSFARLRLSHSLVFFSIRFR